MSSGGCIKDESNKAGQSLGHLSRDQSSLSPVLGKDDKTNFRPPLAVARAMIESSRDVYAMVISKKAGLVRSRFSKKAGFNSDPGRG